MKRALKPPPRGHMPQRRRAHQPAASLRGQVLGIIDPRNLYDTDACMAHAGIGEEKLRKWKAAGAIEGIRTDSGRVWYRGEDLIRAIEQEARQRAT
jgi:hypothetical protein